MTKEKFVSLCKEKQIEAQNFLNEQADDGEKFIITYEEIDENEEQNFFQDKDSENFFCDMIIPPIFQLLKESNLEIEKDGTCEDEWIAAIMYIYTYLMVFAIPYHYKSETIYDNNIEYFIQFDVEDFGDLYDLIKN